MIDRLRAIFWFIKAPLMYWARNFQVQYRYSNIRIHPSIIWIYNEINSIDIASQVTIGAFSEIVVEDKFSTEKISSKLLIQESVVIGSCANIRASGGQIFIGRNSLVGQKVSLIASNHKLSSQMPYRNLPLDDRKNGIYINENVWLGAGVTVLPGCTIGMNSVVGAGSVVTKNIPPNEIWAGIPARKIKDLLP